MNSLIRSLSAVMIGVLLVFLKESAMPILVRLVGVAFFLPALVSIINVYMTRREAPAFPSLLISIVDIGSMFFGLWLLVSPVMFLEFFVVMLALVLLGFSLFQIFMVLAARRYNGMHWGFLTMPSLLAVFSVVILVNPFGTVTTATMILGVCAIVSGVSDILIYLLTKRNTVKDVEEID